MQKKQTILVVASLLVVILSVTLAYFTAQIIGKGKDISVSSADLKIVFTDTDGNIEGSNITPGWSDSKTFTVENQSNGTYKYDIIIKDLVNTFKTYKYLQYKITSTDGGYNMTDYSYLPKSSSAEDVALAYEVSIDKGKTHTYTIEIKYVNDEEVDQSIDMGKTLSGTIYIREFTKPTMKLTDKLMADNPMIDTRTDFSTTFTKTNTGTLYKATEQIGSDTARDVYYFAGDAKNNWVKFGKTTESSCTYKGKEIVRWFVDTNNYNLFKNIDSQEECEGTNICVLERGPVIGLDEWGCVDVNRGTMLNEKATWNGTTTKDIYWRIIRTNYDGSIKLLYTGTSPDTTKAYIGMSEFNTTYDDPMYVGYKYGTTGSLENNRTNENDSTIKTYVDNWYKTNLNDYTKFLSNDAVYCNDREVAIGQTYSTTMYFEYASSFRIGLMRQPTYNCTNMSDAFSVNNTSAKLDYPIGLISVDELVYAGGQHDISLNEPYVWYYTNVNKESTYATLGLLSMSPNAWDDVPFIYTTFDFFRFGDIESVEMFSAYDVRPSISLSSCNLISRGDGSPENPYEIYTGSGVCE